VSDLTLRYVPDASHWVQQDRPDHVNELLGAWLEGKPVLGATEPGTQNPTNTDRTRGGGS